MKASLRAALFLTAALLTGCGAAVSPSVSESEPAKAVSAAPQEAAPETSENINAAEIRESDRELTEEEILAAYDRAVSAYEWFELSPLPCDGPVRLEDGVEYRRVEYAGFGTLEDLRTYLGSLFSEELISRLLAQDTPVPRYRDIDGALYVRPGGRAADAGKGAAAAAVEREEDGSYLINVTVDLLDGDLSTVAGVEFYAFPYREVGGRWIFTDFWLVY